MWKKFPECRNHPYCPLMEKRKEHMVYLIFDYHEGGDKLPITSGRYMTQETGQKILQYEMSVAQQLEKTELVVVIKGGDPTKRFSELKELCEWAWEEASERLLNLCFDITLDVENFAPEHGDWYVEHAEKLMLWSRCTGLNLKALEFAKVFGGGVLYELNVNYSEDTVSQISKIQRFDVPVRMQLATSSEEWSLETQGKYEKVLEELMKYLPEPEKLPWMEGLKRLECARDGQNGDAFYGRCYDPNGWQWVCPALSQLHLFSWDMEDEPLQKIIDGQSGAAIRWVCPGEALKWKDNKKFLQHKQIAEYTNATIFAARDKNRKPGLKELLLEAARNER